MKGSSFTILAFVGYLLYRSYEKAATEIVADVAPVNTPQGLSVKVTLTNPNINPFYISAATLHVFAGPQKIRVGTVAITQPVFLGPQSTTEFVPVITPNDMGLFTVLGTMPINQPVAINVTGTVTIGAIDIPVDFSTAFDLT